MRPALRVLLAVLLLPLAHCTRGAPPTVDAGVPDAGASVELPNNLQVRVLGPGGAPLASTPVQLVSESLDVANAWLETDAKGEVAHPTPAPGRYRVLAYWLEKGRFQRYEWKDLELRPGRSGARVEFRFAPSSTPPVSGQVKGLDGVPAAGATIEAFQHFTSVPLHEDFLRDTTGPRETATVKADAEGRFTLQLLRGGEYGLRVRSERGLADVTVHTGGPAADIVVVPRCVRSASGRVVDERGAPVTRFLVGEQRVRDAQGRFQLQGGCFTYVEAPGFVTQALPLLSLKSLNAALPDIVLPRARQLTGRVVGPDGKPAGEARLQATWAGASGAPNATSAKDSGRFSLGPVPAGREVTLLAQWGGLSLLQRVAPTHEGPVEVRHPARDARLEVVIKDASGAPLRYVDVEAKGAWGSVRLRTDEAGRAVQDAPSGSYELHVTHKPPRVSGKRSVGHRFAPMTVQVGPGNNGPVELRATRGTGRLRVLLPESTHYDAIIVIRGAHEAPANVQGFVELAGHPVAADVASDRQDQYSSGLIYYETQKDFSDLPPGPYTVFAQNPRDDGPGLLLFHKVVQVDGQERQVVQVRYEGEGVRRLY